MDLHLETGGGAWLALCASPRRHGASAHAVRLLVDCLAERALHAERLHLAEYTIAPCTGCGLCSHQPGCCALDAAQKGTPDDAAMLLARLRAASGLVIAAPVYFYGLPAQFKALIDRSQRYWAAGAGSSGRALRPAYAVLPAGRERGERLFEGCLLTLRAFLPLIGFTLVEHLPLRGMDTQTPLPENAELAAHIRAWGQACFAALGDALPT